MNLLMVGADGRGSWAMRGVQLGHALGARVALTPSEKDWTWAEAVVLVKRAAFTFQRDVSKLRVPVIWDVLDFWDQPDGNGRTEDDLVEQVKDTAETIRAVKIIGATQTMATAIGGEYVPHHCRIGLTPTPIRTRARVVGYDGQKKYLGKWLTALDAACQKLGLSFVVNPPDLRAVDVLVSFRDGKWDGWACREWKSGVKYVNAICAGRPIVTQPAAAYRELHPAGELVTHPVDLVDSLAYVTRDEMRELAYQDGLDRAASFTVEAIATQYAQMLLRATKAAA